MPRYTRAHPAIFDTYRELAQTHIAPFVARHDKNATLNRDAWRALGRAGLFEMVTWPGDDDAVDLTAVTEALEGLVIGSGDLGFAVSAVAQLCAIRLLHTSNHDPRRLAPLLSGKAVAAVANAERGAGTNIMALRTTATIEGDTVTITGEKASITNLGVADVVLVSARVEGAKARRAIEIYALDAHTKGLEQQKELDLIGLRTSPTGHLTLDRASAPLTSRVGGPGAGVAIFREVFSLERLLTGALYLGALRYCLDRALDHIDARRKAGAPIGQHQHIQARVVEIRVAERLLAATLAQATTTFTTEADIFEPLSVIKLHGLDAAQRAAEHLVCVLGRAGVLEQEGIGKLQRDLSVMAIFGGTLELQKMVVYNGLDPSTS